ncbi:MAG: triose-phosphate isomerase [Kiritimatiellaeota bacterium]|nr:triose-phosphate isomerase [Kiritimatiellota bacterium]
MSRRLLIAGNWKMNKTATETERLAGELRDLLGDVTEVDIAVCPPFTSLAAAVRGLAGTPVRVGAQNIHWAEAGAFTGEISAAMLKGVPVEYVIIGHSERRQYFGETDATVNKRLRAALSGNLKPIVCIGETLDQREAGITDSVIERQLTEGLADLSPEDASGMIIAYEPVWAIGTGRTATPAQAQQVHEFIRGLLRDRFGSVAESIRVLYGGSMKPTNAADLLRQPDIDGGLVA